MGLADPQLVQREGSSAAGLLCPLCRDEHEIGVPFVTRHHSLSLRSPISVDRPRMGRSGVLSAAWSCCRKPLCTNFNVKWKWQPRCCGHPSQAQPQQTLWLHQRAILAKGEMVWKTPRGVCMEERRKHHPCLEASQMGCCPSITLWTLEELCRWTLRVLAQLSQNL